VETAAVSLLGELVTGRHSQTYVPSLLRLVTELDLRSSAIPILRKPADAPPGNMSAGQKLILAFKAILTRSGHYDYILIDSRTGHSDEAGICTRDLVDHRMVVSGHNHQNICGTTDFLRDLRASFKSAKLSIRTPDIILSPVPNSEDDLVFKRSNHALSEFRKAWGGNIPLDLLIPYHPRLALTEEAYVPTLTASPLRASYLEIEKRLLQSLEHQPVGLQTHFLQSIQKRDGATALHALQRMLKLSCLPMDGGIQSLPQTLYVAFLSMDGPLKNLAELPQALDVLKLLAASRDEGYFTLQIAKILHSVNPVLATTFDEYLLHRANIHPDELGNYAIFLTDIRKDHDAAEAFYKRAIDADPKHATNLGNYGQALIGRGRTDEGLRHLRSAWSNLDKTKVGNAAELAYSLWLGTCLSDSEEPVWERAFKHLIEKRFPRHPWNFDAMLAQAKKKLKPTDYNYAKALASAFLDESEVPALEKFPRWKKLQPLDPALVNPDGTIREAKKT
jgi:tetratricopeptide (TPR) repeat protein